MHKLSLLGLLWVTLAACTPHAGHRPQDSDLERANRLLDQLHLQAAAADYKRYFELYTEDAVFLGTDRSEYWPLEAFKAYSKPHFDKGKGWTYTPLKRELHFFENTAWFEEELLSESYGQVRGTGVLVRTELGWKVAQYNLTLPIPNPMFGEIANDVKDFYRNDQERGATAQEPP